MSNNNPETLMVSVKEDIKTKDVPPGTNPLAQYAQSVQAEQKKNQTATQENLTPEELEQRQKFMLELTRLSERYVPPHNIKSKWVKEKDIPTVLADGKDMIMMCALPRGKYLGIAALAHSQIEDKNPLRFFVLPSGMVIINPVIINHTSYPVFKEEGCMSYENEAMKTLVPRFNKIIVTYQTLRQNDKKEAYLSEAITEELNGNASHVFQHELCHLNGFNLYDEGFDPHQAAGFGDGLPVDPSLWIWKKADTEDKKDENKK